MISTSCSYPQNHTQNSLTGVLCMSPPPSYTEQDVLGPGPQSLLKYTEQLIGAGSPPITIDLIGLPNRRYGRHKTGCRSLWVINHDHQLAGRFRSSEGDRAKLLAHPNALDLPDMAVREGRTRAPATGRRIVGFVSWLSARYVIETSRTGSLILTRWARALAARGAGRDRDRASAAPAGLRDREPARPRVLREGRLRRRPPGPDQVRPGSPHAS